MTFKISYEFTDSFFEYISANKEKTFEDWIDSLSDESVIKLEEYSHYGMQCKAKSENAYVDLLYLVYAEMSMPPDMNVINQHVRVKLEYMLRLNDKALVASHRRGLPMMRNGLKVNWQHLGS